MRSVVVGVFDELESARRVIGQLAASPLDLRRVTVFHSIPEVQARLTRDAGVPSDKTYGAGAVIGGMVGAVVAVVADASLATGPGSPGPLGPMLAAAAGALGGAALGATASILADPLPLPEAARDELAVAVTEGATAVVVQVDGAPTARALSNLFQAAGSRTLPGWMPSVPQVESLSGALVEDPASRPEHSAFMRPGPSDADTDLQSHRDVS